MDILNVLQTHSGSRKIFGKRELKIIEKQLLGINLTQSEKNRLSRDIRKKFECISVLARFQDAFELKKGFLIKKKIEEAKEIILEDQEYKNIEKIVLYGSAAENMLTFNSDLDIAVTFKTISLKDATQFRKRILGKVNEKIDLQVYNYLPKKIKEEIDTKGKNLYEK